MQRIILFLMLIAVAGCSSIPSIPASPRWGQTPAVVEADETACASTATAPRALSYAACMIARGYTVTATIPGPGNTVLNLNIGGPDRSAGTERVRGDLEACGVSLATTGRLLVTGGLATAGAVERREREYIACLTGRGYSAVRWEPK